MPDTVEVAVEPPKPVSIDPDAEVSPQVKMFVADVRYCWKWASTWLLSLAALAPMALEFVPQLQGVVSPKAEHLLYSALAFLAFIARITNQSPKGN